MAQTVCDDGRTAVSVVLPGRQLHVSSISFPVVVVVFLSQVPFTNSRLQLAKITPALVVLHTPTQPSVYDV